MRCLWVREWGEEEAVGPGREETVILSSVSPGEMWSLKRHSLDSFLYNVMRSNRSPGHTWCMMQCKQKARGRRESSFKVTVCWLREGTIAKVLLGFQSGLKECLL